MSSSHCIRKAHTRYQKTIQKINMIHLGIKKSVYRTIISIGLIIQWMNMKLPKPRPNQRHQIKEVTKRCSLPSNLKMTHNAAHSNPSPLKMPTSYLQMITRYSIHKTRKKLMERPINLRNSNCLPILKKLLQWPTAAS